jgi:RIO-like serine/threonine protein kinase
MTSLDDLDGRPAVFTKDIQNPLEAELQDVAASKYGFAPKIQSINGNSVQMDCVEGQCLADIYTDDATMIPDAIWFKIEHMLAVLFEREGIEYVDITSYNFIEDATGNIWIIDFGDAYYTSNTKGEQATNWFLRSVLAGDSGKAWNPDFA